MTSSGTTNFNLDVIDLIEEAYELVGMEMRGGYQMKTARRSLDMLMREWGNRGLNFWTIRETIIPVSAGTTKLTLASDVIDILDASWRTGSGLNQNDRILTRIDMVNWSQMANKNNPGYPTQYWVNRVVPAEVHLWPVPSDSTGQFVFYGIRSIQDVGAYSNTMDIPPRFLPALTSGLAYFLSIKTPGAEARIPLLKAEYDRQYEMAADEDRERAPFKLTPDLTGYLK